MEQEVSDGQKNDPNSVVPVPSAEQDPKWPKWSDIFPMSLLISLGYAVLISVVSRIPFLASKLNQDISFGFGFFVLLTAFLILVGCIVILERSGSKNRKELEVVILVSIFLVAGIALLASGYFYEVGGFG